MTKLGRHSGRTSRMGLRGAAAALTFAVVLALGPGATPSAQAQTFTVLYTFTGPPDGAVPYAGLIRDAAGSLYGTTQAGGTGSCSRVVGNGCGTVFKLDKTGEETVLYSFGGTPDGAFPVAGLIRDATGNLYGTTEGGGRGADKCNDDGCGTVFELDTNGVETPLYRFTGSDGANPQGSLLRDVTGDLYGSTLYGGPLKFGTLFKLNEAHKLTVLRYFNRKGTGEHPYSGLIQDTSGNLYGTTSGGGCCGVVFEVTKSGHETVLYYFDGNEHDGQYPFGGLIRDTAGNMYGTTTGGGAYDSGAVFELTAGNVGTVLYSFTGGADGAYPTAGLIQDAAGNLYGTTEQGADTCFGLYTCGTVFKLDTTGNLTVLHTFTGGSDGGQPYGGLVLDAAGNLYGTAAWGGDLSCAHFGCGVVFEITP